MNDLLYIIDWWAHILAMGVVFLPITMLLFSKFYDRGYILSKTVALSIISYFLWLLSSLKLISFAQTNLWLVLLLFAFINGLVVYFNKESFLEINWKTFLRSAAASEIMFFAGLSYWSFIRANQPDIKGLEKFMDFGFINSILRSDFMPPPDIWWAEAGINYYYFGHFMAAVVTKLSAIPSEVTYNLWMATMFAVILTFTYCITTNLISLISKNKKAIIIGGGVSALMMSFAGNLHTFFVGFLGTVFTGKKAFEGYWYPDATRYIGYKPETQDKTIHEFPSYSMIVSDLHAHVIDMLIVFTIIALIAVFVIRIMDRLEDYEWHKPQPEVIMFAFLLGCSYIANAWDFPIYLMAIGIALLFVNLKKYGITFKALYTTVIIGIVLIIVPMLMDLPFTLNFKNIAGGVAIAKYHTPIEKYFVLWGHFLFMTVSFIWLVIKLYKRTLQKSQRSRKAVEKRPFAEHLQGFIEKLETADIIAATLLIAAVVLIIAPEIIYVRDIYEQGYARSNTMFKLVYQGYLMFTVVFGYALIRLWQGTEIFVDKKWIRTVMVLTVIMALMYPFFSIKGYYGDVSEKNYKGLDGLRFLKKDSLDDYNTAMWFNKNVSGQPNILEANGDSYTDYCRISMVTGLPTIMGWRTHQWLWRSDVKMVDARIEEVKTIYESEDTAKTNELLKKYKIKYIVIGELETKKFEKIKTDKLLALGEIAYQSGKTRVIKLK